MAYREFSDTGGREWRVWDTYPQKPQIVAPGFENGWLSFETEGEKWRLAPVPAGWDSLPELALHGLLRAAREAATPAPAARASALDPVPAGEPAPDAVPDTLAGTAEPEPV
ncbi:MAG TPA: hypothetical protein VK358_17560 [Longimicrobium sp.]|nr:hypothetical protein [Longimicrobium sp.]